MTPAQDHAYQGFDAFSTAFLWSSISPGNISFNTQYKDASSMKPFADCSGMLVVQNCSLRAATVQYPIIIDGNKSTISLDPSTNIIDDVVNEILDYAPVDM